MQEFNSSLCCRPEENVFFCNAICIERKFSIGISEVKVLVYSCFDTENLFILINYMTTDLAIATLGN